MPADCLAGPGVARRGRVPVAVLLWPLLLLAQPPVYAQFVVDNATDRVDVLPGDGRCSISFVPGANKVCTLRAAIQETNAVPGLQSIILPAGLYRLTRPGALEDAGATGDLDITDDLSIEGAGAATTIIDGNQLDRVLHVHLPSFASVYVGGVTIRNGAAPLSGPSLEDRSGGGILLETEAGGVATLFLDGCVVTDNQSAEAGGGIFVAEGTTLDLARSRVSNNQASGAGGGICGIGGFGEDRGEALLEIRSSTVSGNRGTFGGIDLIDGQVQIANSTISGNVGSFGGGLVLFATRHSMTAQLIHTTITGNVSVTGVGAGGLSASVSSGAPVSVVVEASHSLIAGNVHSSGFTPDCNWTLTSQGHNLVGDTTGCTIVGDLTGNVTNVSANLAPLANYGGPTRTHALLCGSPAVDAGSTVVGYGVGECRPTDQRNVPRPQPAGGTCDIGAFEGCIVDPDGDGVDPDEDNCAGVFNPDQRDSDGSCGEPGEDPTNCGDLCDPCPSVFPDTCDTAQTAGASIDATGGTVATPDGLVTVDVPPGAVADQTSISITRVATGSFALGVGARAVTVVDLEPSGPGVFAAPVTLTFGWNNVGSGTEPFCRVDYGDTNPMREGHLQVYREGVPLAAPCGEGLTPVSCTETAQCLPCLAPACVTACCDPGPPGAAGGNTWTVRVTEFSEYALAARACGETDRPRIIVGRLHTPPGDDKLTLKGETTLPAPITPALDPVAGGVRLLLDDAAGHRLDVTVPGGAFVREQGIGWKVNRKVPPTRWTWVHKGAAPPAGIRRVVVRDKSAREPGLVTFLVKGKEGDYAALGANPPLTGVVVLDPPVSATGQCAELAFPGEPAPSCGFDRSGHTLRCR